MRFSEFIFEGGAAARIAVLLTAAAVDLLLGDPHWLWHPVQGIGTLINVSESFFRKIFGVPWTKETETRECGQTVKNALQSGGRAAENALQSGGQAAENAFQRVGQAAENALQSGGQAAGKTLRNNGQQPDENGRGDLGRRERAAGICMVLTVLAASVGITVLLLYVCGRIHPRLRILAEGILCGRLLALRSLGEAGRSVRDPLRAGDLEGARKAVSMIVGRDTDRLDAEGIAKAAVETVAENTSDGVTAPLFYMILFGGPGGVFYKAVNTMDSMTGYKNRRYRYFGTAAARLDDVLNYIPSRLTALLMILACYFPAPAKDRSSGRAPDGKSAFRIWRRDRAKSPSPNSAQTESVCAGALHLRLLGDTWYFGELHRKAEIGDGGRNIEPEDITRAVRLMVRASFLLFAAGIAALALLA